jgi:hypothetical protein
MSRNQKLLKLSIATAALLIAAAPGFAQTKSSEARNDAAAATDTVAFNFERTASPFTFAKSNRTSDNVSNTKSTVPSKFRFTASQFSVGENNLALTKPQSTIYEVRINESVKEFGNDNFMPASSKRLSFVPSRGPKYPY